uniref:Tyrosinase copper-binding domain-containing protein n=1 Tax=Magallana gigas TaxID=29159 RepID=A0A8W8JXK3_MAGGI
KEYAYKDFKFQTMPSLMSVLHVLVLFLAIFPISRLQIRTQTNANSRFVQWMNGLFYLPRGNELRVRKEYRLLSDEERRSYHQAILLLKNDRTVLPNKFDAIASLHHLNTASGAHGGPGFLGWHRIYLTLFENALREKVPNVTIPYWDNTLDAELPDPRRSIMWSPLFFGNGNGAVVTGPFRRFTTPYGPLRRDIGADRRLMSKTDLENVFSRRWMWEISNPSAEDRYNLELLHNHVHVWIGEQMSRIESSSYDPAFFSHHAFVDCLWEEFRQRQRQHGINPGRDYPRIVGDQGHQPLVSMGLGRLLVVDGINDIFTQRIYSCQRRPECVPGTNHCGSPYIRCNWSTRTCLPLIMSNRPNNPVAQGPAQQQVPWWARLMQRNGLFG